MHNNLSNKPSQNINPNNILQKLKKKQKQKTVKRIYRFSGLSRACINLPGLSSPGKCQNKIPGLSRISMTRANPAPIIRDPRLHWHRNLVLLAKMAVWDSEREPSEALTAWSD